MGGVVLGGGGVVAGVRTWRRTLVLGAVVFLVLVTLVMMRSGGGGSGLRDGDDEAGSGGSLSRPRTVRRPRVHVSSGSDHVDDRGDRGGGGGGGDARSPVSPLASSSAGASRADGASSASLLREQPAVRDRGGVIDYEAMFARESAQSSSVAMPKRMTFWSTDMHISPIDSLKAALREFDGDFRVIDKSLSGHCHLKNTCASDLRVLNRDNAPHLNGCDESFKQQFYNAYRSDDELLSADVFACHYAVELCELYMPFAHGRSIYISLATRFEFGRDKSDDGFRRLVNNLRLIASAPGNVIASNNLLDQMYLYYYSGIKALWVPDLCSYVTERYAPKRSEIIIMQDHGKGLDPLVRGLESAKHAVGGDAMSLSFRKVRDLYQKYEFSDLAQHRAVIAVPYQVSVMKYFELYWMGVPLLMPSREFFAKLHVEHGVINQLTWQHAYTDQPASGSRAPRHPSVKEDLPDPQAERNFESMHHWIGYSDWYQWENVVLFDSWEDAVRKALSTDFAKVSKAMLKENEKRLADYNKRMAWMMNRMARPAEAYSRELPDSETESMKRLYGDDYFTDAHVGRC